MGQAIHEDHWNCRGRGGIAVRRNPFVIAAVVAAAFGLASCGSSSSSSKTSSVAGPNINAKGEGALNIVDWEGYSDPSYVKAFTQQTGCKVNSVSAGTSDEMFT